MKNVKLILLVTTTMLLFGMGTVSAQVNSVMVSGNIDRGKPFSISVVHPDYKDTVNKYNGNDKKFHVALKEELDKWLLLGYEVVESNIVSNAGTASYLIIYFLVKKD